MCSISRFLLPLLSLLTMLSSHILQTCKGDASYENITALMNRLLGPTSGYNPNLRPRNFQYDTVIVEVAFSMVSLEEIDDVKKSFATNGFLLMEWKDEKLGWDEEDYGGMHYITPNLEDIWRPQLVLMNTLGDRDVFKEENFPFIVYSDGYIKWMAGGIIKASCGLDMTKYPFDKQKCSMLFCPTSHAIEFMTLEVKYSSFDFTFYVSNEAWDLTHTQVKTSRYTSMDTAEVFSCVELIIEVKRRSSYFILNLICPVLMLSFLNNFVFLMPDESGEKIGYGITVLLSLSVFLTTVSTMIPRASDNIPAVTIYLFVLLSTSVLSVLASIATVHLHHSQEDGTDRPQPQDKSNNNQQDNKLFRPRLANGTVEPMKNPTKVDQADTFSNQVIDFRRDVSDNGPSLQAHIYKMTIRHVNKICFFMSMFCWIVTHVTFILYVIT